VLVQPRHRRPAARVVVDGGDQAQLLGVQGGQFLLDLAYSGQPVLDVHNPRR
jgi:hypothetical protein